MYTNVLVYVLSAPATYNTTGGEVKTSSVEPNRDNLKKYNRPNTYKSQINNKLLISSYCQIASYIIHLLD